MNDINSVLNSIREYYTSNNLSIPSKVPEVHVLYSDYFPTLRRWVCDFKIEDYWIEVSNFKQDFKNYFSNIEEKRDVVESNGGTFFFVTSLKELQELVSLM